VLADYLVKATDDASLETDVQEPYAILRGLDIADLEDLHADIKVYGEIDVSTGVLAPFQRRARVLAPLFNVSTQRSSVCSLIAEYTCACSPITQHSCMLTSRTTHVLTGPFHGTLIDCLFMEHC